MDQDVIAALGKAGIDITWKRAIPVILIQMDDRGNAHPLGSEVPVQSGESFTTVKMKTIPELAVGSRQPPSFAGEPPEEYLPFFGLIEQTAIDYCNCTGQVAYDDEFERLYRHLRRRPAGTDANPLFSYLQAAARLYMSLRDVSLAEFEAVAQRLVRSTRHFSEGAGSKNYYRVLRREMAPYLQ